MREQEILNKLAEEYVLTKRTSRWNRHNGYPDMADQGLHQAQGIVTSATLLGIDEMDFYERVKEIRREKRNKRREEMEELF